MGRFMQGPYAGDIEELCDDYLEHEDGECNLAVAYAAAYASRIHGSADQFQARLNERIEDQSVTGDKLTTWLLARAYTEGAIPGNPLPLAGFSDLESAYLTAESNEHKFWSLQEMVARLSSVNQGDRAKALIEENRGRFTTPPQQTEMAAWITQADTLAAQYAELAADQAESAATVRQNELELRRQMALDRGDTAAAARFAELLGASQQNEE
jgi:hypothetical protein